jgi:hypothetical protein
MKDGNKQFAISYIIFSENQRMNLNINLNPANSNRVTRGCGLIFPALFMIFWVGMSLFFFTSMLRTYFIDLDRYTQLNSSQATRGSANITALNDLSDSESDDYHIVYTFRAVGKNGDGVAFTHNQQVSKNTFLSHQVGETASILYMTANPEISSLVSELHLPSLLGVIFSSVFVLFGLGMTFLLIRKFRGTIISSKSPASPFSATILPNLPVDSNWIGSNIEDSWRCSRCMRSIDENLMNCQYRSTSSCPLTPSATSSLKVPWLGWLLLLLGGGFLLITISGLLRVVATCFTIGALLALIAGLVILFIRIQTLADPLSGQYWLQVKLANSTIVERIIGSKQVVNFKRAGEYTRIHPASIAALARTPDSSHLLYYAFLSLMDLGCIVMSVSPVRTRFLRRSPSLNVLFSFTIGNRPLEQGEGALESCIYQNIHENASRTTGQLKLGNLTVVRENPNLVTLSDLVHFVYGRDVASPDTFLAANITGQDAVERGLGRFDGRLIKNFKLDEKYRAELMQQCQDDDDLQRTFVSTDPSLASAFFPVIQNAVRSMQQSSD